MGVWVHQRCCQGGGRALRGLEAWPGCLHAARQSGALPGVLPPCAPVKSETKQAKGCNATPSAPAPPCTQDGGLSRTSSPFLGPARLTDWAGD